KDIDRAGKLHGIDRPIRVRIVPVDDLHHTRTPEALQRLGRGIGLALLRRVEGLANIPADLLREVPQSLAARSHPDDRLEVELYYTTIRILILLSNPEACVRAQVVLASVGNTV